MYAAGIVLYNPEIQRLRENITAIINQVDFLVLVDNASQNVKDVELCWGKNKKVQILKNNSNKGIAVALNQIMEQCKKKGAEWVLTLDQDSVCPDKLVYDFAKKTLLANVGIVCPIIKDRNDKYKKKINIPEEEVNQCITSGSFISIKVWEKVGRFDEKMFIDMVDFEFCARVRLNGYRIIRINSVILLHECGKLKVVKIGPREIQITNHSPLRCYYYAKNIVYCQRKLPEAFSKKWRNKFLFEKVIKVLVFEKQKVKKLIEIVRGIKKGRTEKIEA